MRSCLKIYAYYTHYEIVNYEKGDCVALEKILSVFDDVYFKVVYYCHYDKDKKILYVPRGFDANKLTELLGKPVNIFNYKEQRLEKIPIMMKCGPRNPIQKEAIRFLLGKDEYNYTAGSVQKVLALIGGGGKTYCSTAAMSVIGYKTIVICHTNELIDQWISRFGDYTYIPENSIVRLTSGKQMLSYINPEGNLRREMQNHYVYLASHALINSFISSEGFEKINELFESLGIGLKIIDEFHRNFMNTLMIDYATNVKKTIYLSATPARTDKKEDAIFQLSFDRVFKFKRDNRDFGIESSTIAIYDIFNTNACMMDIQKMYVAKKFNVYKYIDYELSVGKVIERVTFWLDWLYNGRVTDGTIYVLSPKKDSCDILYEVLKKTYKDKKVCVHYSQNKVDNVEDYDIVCGTVKMFGTGKDIEKLKAMIVSEPVGSAVNADQLIHRLMRGKDIGTTYSIDLIDKSVPNVVAMYRRRKKIYASYVKKSYDFLSYKNN